jgi:hypothetical protein
MVVLSGAVVLENSVGGNAVMEVSANQLVRDDLERQALSEAESRKMITGAMEGFRDA